ncbi:DUF2911 domain-containing protein [Chitinophaga polysaccharea]|uniref:DUF2911 domain-containing protein n=1 Tax=Chitinophaga TaxID=79328 RepID=UPI001454FB18|nr:MULTISPECIES: DUF2911 domain-containing protein [Chitinophaga]NLR58742.1 DUF2911 domain-containing protein [Chitinophaga polysaccharea]NLU91273.1 DUF2911 domain-containing protein [Chitinophaga sp. Ak27]
MKHFFLATLFLAVTSLVFAQEKPPKSPHVTVEANGIKVVYGQPSKRGRVIFGTLEPWGKVWRTGADQATEITFSKDVVFGGKPVKAGTYTFFSIPDPKTWTVILNGKLGQWGAYDYEKNKGEDVVAVKVKREALSTPVEKLTFTLPGNAVVFEWDDTRISVPVK